MYIYIKLETCDMVYIYLVTEGCSHDYKKNNKKLRRL